jgi:catechol 2,3-dioxygenase-like lactoylglutathione lyase family enzyme
MIKSMNHMSFTVRDLDVSVTFYRNILGLELENISSRDPLFSEKVTGIKGANLKIAYMKAPNCSVELIQYLSPVGKHIDTATNNVGSAHVCFIVDNFDKQVKMLKENRVHIVSVDGCLVPEGPNIGKGVVYFHDPDNNTIEFISENRNTNGR